MKPFLYYVAKDLIGRFGNNLSEVTIVFPGKRAQLYMKQFLSHFAQGPVWAPRFVTIDELFQQMSPYSVCEPILSVCMLYRIYAQLVTNPKPLDDFYGWGEMLMNDFDDIDKHLADAEKLFTNVADLAEMDEVDYLDDKQIAALRDFFTKFDPERQTELKRRFLEVWKVMPEMYRQLNETLRREGMLYRGALYREVVEKVLPFMGEPEGEQVYCFVGFNVLDEVEEALFGTLRDRGQTLFYWDYDLYYASPESTHEAGLFLRHNLKLYPNALPEALFDNLISDDKHVTILSASTDNAQVRYLPQWISEHLTKPENQSAIILCDEALMQPALHAMPETTVNVTMGYPLTSTAVYGYYSALIDLQTDGYDPDLRRFRPSALERLSLNPFYTCYPQETLPLTYQTDNLTLVRWLTAAFEALGTSLGSTKDASPLDIEASFQIYRILGQFDWLLTHAELEVSILTLRRLLRQVLASASIPFHGEMDQGLQIMGVLEARNLDFQHLIMLSVGEGIIPKKASETSLIPYILRAHFGLDTTERQDSVYAYSFYRLLQRADDITLVYNDNSSGVSQREQSRFLRQLKVETPLDIEQGSLNAPLALLPTEMKPIPKDERIMARLREKHRLSPTAINQYIECPVRFYYQQVAGLRMPNRPQDGIDNALFGTLFHDSCELFYTHLTRLTGRKQVLADDLTLSPLSLHLSPYLDLAFWVDYFHGTEFDSYDHGAEREAFLKPFLETDDRGQLATLVRQLYAEGINAYFTGINMIIRDVLLKLFAQLIRWDAAHTPFTIFEMEKDHYTQVEVPSDKEVISVSIGGRIDRMDVMNIDGRPTLRVVDYKTGREKRAPSTIEAIFDGDSPTAHGYYLQTFLYSLAMSREQALPVSPCLFYVLSATDPTTYDPTLRLGKEVVTDIRNHAKDYLDGLTRVLQEIYDSKRPFEPADPTKDHCKYCDFRTLCNRKT
ncbi:MAG: PD-(D/E)XK nuclease family protein [Bacteroidaceae bacterium]|nr:PD-(D/E)XK nuclease family protein [Bacteroidaceae bacterium]